MAVLNHPPPPNLPLRMALHLTLSPIKVRPANQEATYKLEGKQCLTVSWSNWCFIREQFVCQSMFPLTSFRQGLLMIHQCLRSSTEGNFKAFCKTGNTVSDACREHLFILLGLSSLNSRGYGHKYPSFHPTLCLMFNVVSFQKCLSVWVFQFAPGPDYIFLPSQKYGLKRNNFLLRIFSPHFLEGPGPFKNHFKPKYTVYLSR